MRYQNEKNRCRPLTAWIPLGAFLSILVVGTPGLASETAATPSHDTCAEATASQIFTAQTCTRCHSVTDRTGELLVVPAARTPPSAGALRRGSDPMKPERVKKLLEKRFDGRGMRHPVSWKGDDAELSCLIAWIGGDLPASNEPTHPGRRRQ